MSLTQIAVLLAGIVLLLEGLGAALGTTGRLVFGIAIIALVFLDSDFVRARG